MTACPPLMFAGITREVVDRIKAEIAKNSGIAPGPIPDSGQASAQGYTVEWSYDEAAQTLTVQCLDSPWWAPCTSIGEAITEMVNNAKGLSA